ncbi:hypothetical protein BGW36DRAFT_463112 [Talaromyces proteolyticus]|uniref:DUF7702 domain-containing protein n=1 Tax=Talaromyces proteolyticus TaxID=1131652 RepID=A0AAD4KRS5_9EURO|nr:uncharacterized protein BGW36DRAFT_463112 [Talaromyces proteolyticus]KAH8695541.1 hypothetical protein BGW36DRAFT_463112 [Talaromyces proteolyticus]
MGTVTYHKGIATLWLVIFPFILIAATFGWKWTRWKAGGKIWRYAIILCLLRVAGSIFSLLSINNDSEHIAIAEAVCGLIGIAPLSLAYVGLLRQIDREEIMPPRPMALVPFACLIGLILAIKGVSDSSFSHYTLNKLVKAAMGVFLTVFVIIIFHSDWLFYELSFLRNFQKKLFIAIALSSPFYTARLIYAATGDFS